MKMQTKLKWYSYIVLSWVFVVAVYFEWIHAISKNLLTDNQNAAMVLFLFSLVTFVSVASWAIVSVLNERYWPSITWPDWYLRHHKQAVGR